MSQRPEPPSADDVRRAERAWQRVEDLGGLSGAAELAERWELHERRARALTAREDFPAPVAHVGGRTAWLTVVADAWRARQPASGRPRKHPD